MPRGLFPKRSAVFALATLAALVATGCVKRRYTIRSDPPGAYVWVNGAEIGSTPISKSFTYYGTREIILAAPDGTQKRVLQDIDAPWWDNSFTDFVTENIIPFTFRDEREFNYKIEPTPNPPTPELLTRAEALRKEGMAPLAERKRKGFFWWVPDVGLFQ